MRKIQYVLVAAALVFGAASQVSAQTATASVTYEVQAINEIAVSANPGALVVSTATAGQAPVAASDATTTWAITTNETGKKITGQIDTAMPAGVTLTVDMAAPTGATSAGAVSLGATAADLVTGVSTVAESGMSVTYGLSATVAAGVVPQGTRTVTYTITAGA